MEDPLRRWKKLEEGAAQVIKGDLKWALQYLSRTLADFRNPDPQEDPEGYAVHHMASALRDCLMDMSAIAPMEMRDFGPMDFIALETGLEDFEVSDPGPLDRADDKVCPLCGSPKKAKG